MARKSKLKGYKATDGALAPEDIKQEEVQKKKPRNLAEILGADIDQDNTPDYKNYCDLINSMNLADLYEHSIKVGLMPVDNRNKLIDRLQKQWLKDHARYKDVQIKEDVKMTREKEKELKDILSRARI